MKTLPATQIKAHFSELIDEVKNGEEIIITRGKNKEQVAVLIPYSTYQKKNIIKLGLLKEKSFKIKDDFEMTSEELLGL